MPTNKNHLAEIIRKLSQQQLAVPCLSGAEPLELLLEIGLEKATKDYEYIFTESRICSAKDLAAASSVQAVDESVQLHIRQTLFSAAAAKSQYAGNANDLNKVGFQNSSFARDAVEKRLARLVQIHLLMEHLLLINIHLKFNDSKKLALFTTKKKCT